MKATRGPWRPIVRMAASVTVLASGCTETREPAGPSASQASVACPSRTPVFGPQTYYRDTEKPTTVTSDFCASDSNGAFTLSVVNGQPGIPGSSVSSAEIRINGIQVAGPNDFNQQAQSITRDVNLDEQNEIAVEVMGGPGASLTVTVLGQEPSATATISPDGGSVELEGTAGVTFPPGAFDSPVNVALSATSSQETFVDFTVTAGAVTDGARLPYEVRITSAGSFPDRSVLTLAVPTEFAQNVPSGHEVAVYAQIFQDGGEDVLDSFERLLPANYEPGTGTITTELSSIAYTDRRGVVGTFEAVIIVASAPSAAAEAPPLLAFSAPGGCQAALLRRPLSSLEVTIDQRGAPNMFDPSSKHFGTDYRAADGTEVQAAANGTIELIAWDERPLDEPDPRSGKLIKGYGRYVVIAHDDGTKTIYAHLQEASTNHLKPKQRVTAGTVIGKADNTGGSTASHLHLEYVNKNGQKIDSAPCLAAEHIGGQWVGATSGDVQTEWTWNLFQVGVNVTGTTFAPSQGNITGTMVVNLFYLVIHYPATGAVNSGVVALRGTTLSGNLILTTPTGFTTTFGTVMNRVDPAFAMSAAPQQRSTAAPGKLNADGTASGHQQESRPPNPLLESAGDTKEVLGSQPAPIGPLRSPR